jgi:hypothetical protein
MAERKISTKFAIEGESEYKQAVKSINQEMKVLNSEMAKTASEFSNAQNSMEALTAKSEVLAKQYETQAQRVETMREALQNAQNAQQEWADRQEEAAARVEELSRQLEELKQAEGDTTEEQRRLTEELQQANEALEYSQRGYEAASKGVDDWQIRLNYAEADLNKLDNQIQENNRLMDEARSSADGCATSIDQYGKATKEAGDRAEGMGAQGAAAIAKIIGTGGGGMAGMLGLAMKLINAAKDIAIENKNAEAIMVRGTGAQGEALRELNDIYQEVMHNAKSTSDAVAGSIAALNTRLGLTGDRLTEAATLMEQFGRAAGVDAAQATEKVVDVLNAFGRSSDDLGRTMDLLVKASQASDASVTTLADALANSAFYAKEYGLSMEDTLAIMAAAENAQQGLSGTLSRGMKKAYDDVSASGKTFNQIMRELQNGTMDSADALELFGNKGVNVAAFLQNGTMDIDAMREALRETDGVMAETAANAETFGDKWRGFWNSVWHGERIGTQWDYDLDKIMTDAEAATEVMEEELQPSVESVMNGFMELATQGEFTSGKISELTEYLNENADVLEEEGFAVDELREALGQAGAQLAQLDAETEKAAEGVMGNLDSMMGRFNQVPYTVEQSTVSVIANLQTQMTYMDTYAANMQRAAARGVDEGLLKSLSDGSAESAQILAGIVDATDGEIQVLNEKWNQTQTGKENFSRVMGEIQTDFEERTAEIEATYDEAIQNFNQYDAAYANGARSGQGVIDGLSAKERLLYDKTYNMGASAAKNFNAGFNSIPAPNPQRGYAAGTLSAAPGWAWTGEAGPELILFRGGETVISHEQSMRLAQQALEAQLKAERRADGDLSSPVVVATLQNDVDLRGVEELIIGVINAVNSQQPVEFPAIVNGVDRQLAHERKLVGMAGG